ncbi:hypothetical protein OAF64_06955 [Crocinitomicaceae bacterium]|nr:hypothetical protein [Crocinitomicaceae bacterium]
MVRKYSVLALLLLFVTSTTAQVDFGQARTFMQNRCYDVDMVYEDGFSMDYDGSILHVFLVSQGSSYCVSNVSQYALDVMASKCGGSYKRMDFYDLKRSYSIETDWHRREKERKRKEQDERTKTIVLEHLSNGEVDQAISAYKGFSNSKKNEFKSKISNAFKEKYSGITIKLESNEVKQIVENNKTVFASLKDGNYNIVIGRDGKTQGLQSDVILKPYLYKIDEFECVRPVSCDINIKSNSLPMEEIEFLTLKGGKLCKALIGKKYYRTNWWNRSIMWEKECVTSKMDLSLPNSEVLLQQKYKTVLEVNKIKIDEKIELHEVGVQKLNKRIPKIIWRALTLPIQGIYYILLYF